jgi:hypothetical protein
MKTAVRSFNTAGRTAFEAWLNNPSGAAPKSLLTDETLTELLLPDYHVDLERRFTTSYALGVYLSSEVFTEIPYRFALLASHGMWSWISLAYIDSLLKKSGQPLDKAHYIDTSRYSYRLIARTAWDLVALHGDAAKVALGSMRSPWGEMAEQMTSRQEIYANRSFWPVAHHLYASADGGVKRGATSQRNKKARRDPNSKSGLGGVRRLPFTFKQFDRTYNLRTMELGAIAELLPAEYARWLETPSL